MNKYSNINNDDKNRNTNNIGNNNVKAGFSMTKKMIIVKIVEFLMIVIITVIKLTSEGIAWRKKEKANKQTNDLICLLYRLN